MVALIDPNDPSYPETDPTTGGPGACPPGQHWSGGRCVSDMGAIVGGISKPSPICPSGTTVKKAPDGTVTCVSTGASTPGSGGGVKAGGGGGAVAKAPAIPAVVNKPGAEETELLNIIMKGIRDAMGGTFLPFNEETINRLKANQFELSRGQAAREKQALGRDLVRRGISRSGLAVEGVKDIEAKSTAEYGRNVRQIYVNAVTENYKAKVAALDRAQAALTQQQQVRLSFARTSLDRDIANANIALGYARISAERANLERQLATQLQIAQMGSDNALLNLLAGTSTGGGF